MTHREWVQSIHEQVWRGVCPATVPFVYDQASPSVIPGILVRMNRRRKYQAGRLWRHVTIPEAPTIVLDVYRTAGSHPHYIVRVWQDCTVGQEDIDMMLDRDIEVSLTVIPTEAFEGDAARLVTALHQAIGAVFAPLIVEWRQEEAEAEAEWEAEYEEYLEEERMAPIWEAAQRERREAVQAVRLAQMSPAERVVYDAQQALMRQLVVGPLPEPGLTHVVPSVVPSAEIRFVRWPKKQLKVKTVTPVPHWEDYEVVTYWHAQVLGRGVSTYGFQVRPKRAEIFPFTVRVVAIPAKGPTGGRAPYFPYQDGQAEQVEHALRQAIVTATQRALSDHVLRWERVSALSS